MHYLSRDFAAPTSGSVDTRLLSVSKVSTRVYRPNYIYEITKPVNPSIGPTYTYSSLPTL